MALAVSLSASVPEGRHSEWAGRQASGPTSRSRRDTVHRSEHERRRQSTQASAITPRRDESRRDISWLGGSTPRREDGARVRESKILDPSDWVTTPKTEPRAVPFSEVSGRMPSGGTLPLELQLRPSGLQGLKRSFGDKKADPSAQVMSAGGSAASAALAVERQHTKNQADSISATTKKYLHAIQQALLHSDCPGLVTGTVTRRDLERVWRCLFRDAMTKQELKQFADNVWIDLTPNDAAVDVSLTELEDFFTGEGRLAPGAPRNYDGQTTEVDLILQDSIVYRAPNCRETVWAVVASGDAPRYSAAPKWLSYVSLTCFMVSNSAIVTSIVNFIVGSLPANYSDETNRGSISFFLEATCIAIFTLEFFVKLLACPSKRAFWKSFFTWVDVLAIIPFYIDLIYSSPTGPLVVLRVLRLLRLLRMLKLGKNLQSVQVLVTALSRTAPSLAVSMLGVNLVAITLFGSLVWNAEQEEATFDTELRLWVRSNTSQYGDKGLEIQFQSVPLAMWWTWVTLTTVGYGDMSPSTGMGRAVASITMCCGLILMAFPLTLLANSFMETSEELKRKKMTKARCMKFQQHLEEHAKHIVVIAASGEGAQGDEVKEPTLSSTDAMKQVSAVIDSGVGQLERSVTAVVQSPLWRHRSLTGTGTGSQYSPKIIGAGDTMLSPSFVAIPHADQNASYHLPPQSPGLASATSRQALAAHAPGSPAQLNPALAAAEGESPTRDRTGFDAAPEAEESAMERRLRQFIDKKVGTLASQQAAAAARQERLLQRLLGQVAALERRLAGSPPAPPPRALADDEAAARRQAQDESGRTQPSAGTTAMSGATAMSGEMDTHTAREGTEREGTEVTDLRLTLHSKMSATEV